MSERDEQRARHLVVCMDAEHAAPWLLAEVDEHCKMSGAAWSLLLVHMQAERAGTPQGAAGNDRYADAAHRLGAQVSHLHVRDAIPDLQEAFLEHLDLLKADAIVCLRPPPEGPHQARQNHLVEQILGIVASQRPTLAVHLIDRHLPRSTTSPPRKLPGIGPAGRQGWGLVLLTLFVCTLFSALLEPYFHPANLVPVYLSGVVFVATRRSRRMAIAAVIGSIVLYDLIFVAPRWSLTPIEPQYWVAFAVMLVIGLLISRLVAEGREQAAKADARANRSHALMEFAVTLATARDEEAVCEELTHALQRFLAIKGVVLPASRFQNEEPMTQRQGVEIDLAVVREVSTRSEERQQGALHYIPLFRSADVTGVLVLQPQPQRSLALGDWELVRALASQTAIALERSSYEAQARTAAVAIETERLRSTLLASISHDFRTPLTTIIGSTSAMIEKASALSPAQWTQLLQDVLQEARRLHNLSSRLLDLARLEEGAVRPAQEWCPAEELMAEVKAASEALLTQHVVETRYRPDDLLWCDPQLLLQLVQNLLANAVQHTPKGGLIRLLMVARGRCWHLIVKDSGTGVPLGQEALIFQKFNRAASGQRREGTGLGLSICAAIVKLHGGTIQVSNRGGARFAVTFPQPLVPPSLEEFGA